MPDQIEPTQPNQTATLDPTLVNLAKGIRQTETGGNFNAKGASGEWGAYQYTQPEWEKATKDLGLNYQFGNATPEQQNEVAYKELASWKQQHPDWNIGNFASAWNAGEGEPNAYTGTFSDGSPAVGVNKHGVKFDVPAYAKSVATAYQTLKSGGSVGVDPNNPSSTAGTQIVDNSNQQKTDNPNNASFTAGDNTGNMGNPILDIGQGVGTDLLKMVGNIPSSALNLGKNLWGAVSNPGKTFSNIVNTGAGGLEKAENALGVAGPGGNFDDQKTQMFDKVVGALKNRYGSLEALRKTAVEDPTGLALDLSTIMEGGGAGLSKIGELGGVDELANAGEKISEAGKVINPVRIAAQGAGKVAELGGNAAGSMAKYGIGQITGFSSDDIENLQNGVDTTLTREGLSKEVGDALDKRIADISETGKEYGPVRNAGTTINVDPDFLTDLIAKDTGTGIDENGRIVADASSGIRNSGEVNQLQTIYNRYQPLFENGKMTAGEFLNMRQDLAEMANFEGGHSTNLENISGVMRGELNTAYRDQVPGLEDLDARQSSQLEELKTLRKGLLDNNDNLTDTATNKIANATGKGKAQIMSKLEELSPGISEKIKQLKTVEKIEALRGPSVGTYTRSVIGGGGLVAGIATGNLPVIAGSIAEMILTNPDVASELLKKYGQVKGLTQAVADVLNKKLASTGANMSNISAGANVASKFNPPKSALQ